jgi:hypothetical protein
VPAQAAPVAPPTPASGKALLLKPLTLTKLGDLSFGTIVTSNLPGTVAIPADGSASIVTGGVAHVPSDTGSRARFAGAGTAGQQIIVVADNPLTLSNGLGDTVSVLAITLDGPNVRTIDASRAFFVNVGGILYVAANQPEGIYQATLNVTAWYL